MASSTTVPTKALIWGAAFEKELAYENDQPTSVEPIIESTGRTIPWVQIAFGPSHVAALSLNGHVYTWALGSMGQLGHGDMQNKSVPTRGRSSLWGEDCQDCVWI